MFNNFMSKHKLINETFAISVASNGEFNRNNRTCTQGEINEAT